MHRTLRREAIKQAADTGRKGDGMKMKSHVVAVIDAATACGRDGPPLVEPVGTKDEEE